MLKTRDWKTLHQSARVENVTKENAGGKLQKNVFEIKTTYANLFIFVGHLQRMMDNHSRL